MSLNHQEITDVLTELTPLLLNAKLQKITASSPKTCQLFFHSHRTQRILVLDLTAGQTRLHLADEKIRSLKTPPAWLMKCRKDLENRALIGLGQEKQERIVRMVFKGLGEEPERCLLAELFGKVGRLLLLDSSDQIIFPLIGQAKFGEKYSPPEAGHPPPVMNSRFPNPDPESLAANRAVNDFYQQLESSTNLTQELRTLRRLLTTERKRMINRVQHMTQDLSKTEKAEELSRRAEAIKAHLGQLSKGMLRIDLIDPLATDESKLVVDLDPALTPVQNMQRLFEKSRRLMTARPFIQKRLREENSKIEKLDREIIKLDHINQIEELHRLFEQLSGVIKLPSSILRARPRQRRLPYRAYCSATNKVILVGRSGEDNHTLTFHVAKGSDLWLHARDTHGAHVIVRLERNESIDEQTLLDAATLAAHSSGLKNSNKVEVSYTHVKHVHPIKGAPSGLVSVARSKTILITVEPERLQRIEQSRTDPELDG